MHVYIQETKGNYEKCELTNNPIGPACEICILRYYLSQAIVSERTRRRGLNAIRIESYIRVWITPGNSVNKPGLIGFLGDLQKEDKFLLTFLCVSDGMEIWYRNCKSNGDANTKCKENEHHGYRIPKFSLLL